MAFPQRRHRPSGTMMPMPTAPEAKVWRNARMADKKSMSKSDRRVRMIVALGIAMEDGTIKAMLEKVRRMTNRSLLRKDLEEKANKHKARVRAVYSPTF